MDKRAASLLRWMFPATEGTTATGNVEIAGRVHGREDTHDAFIDVLPRPDGSLALVVGDKLAGSIGASMHMAAVRAVLQVLLRRGESAARILDDANAFLLRSPLTATVMLQVFLGLLNPADGTLTYLGAGSNPA